MLDVIFVAVGLLIILAAAKKGFIGNVIHSARVLLALVATYFLGGKIALLLRENWIGPAVRNFMIPKVEAVQGAKEEGATRLLEEIPAYLRTPELEADLAAAMTGNAAGTQTIADTIATPVATLISNVLGYVTVFVLALVVLWLAVKLLDGVIERIKILDRLNTILGAVWGVILACLTLFVIGSVFRVFLSHSEIYTESTVIRFFGESALLRVMGIFDVGGMLFSNLLG